MTEDAPPAPTLPMALVPYAKALVSGTTRHGDLTWFRHDDPIGKALSLYGEWAQAEIQLLSRLLRPGDTAADVGSYIGTHTAAFARAVGASGRVIAFEPQPVVVDVLRRNAADSPAPVEVFHAAVGATAGAVRVTVPDVGHRGNFGASSLGDAGEDDQSVPVVALDDLPISELRLLKLDVEGMESAALEGAARTLSDCRPIVYAEINTLTAGAPVLAALQQAGYEVWLHRPAAYNADNFKGEQKNVFGVACESNLLAVPSEKVVEITPLLPGPSEAISIASLDDLATELQRTPRYGDDQVGDRDAEVVLARLGTLQREHSERTAQWTARLEELDAQAVASRDERDEERKRGDVLSAALQDTRGELEAARREAHDARREAHDARREAQNLLHDVARARELADGHAAEVQALVAKLEAVRREAAWGRARLAAIEASTAWRVSAPIRVAGEVKRALLASPAGRALRLLGLLVTGRLPADLRQRKYRRQLSESGLFDGEYYTTTNPDVSATSALDHYLVHGGFEGRRPNRIFDGDWYLETYPDVAATGLNPLVHYAVSGANEGRDPAPGFSSSYYLATNDDVRDSGTNPLAHYLRHGQDEGRLPRPRHEDDDDDNTIASRPTAPSPVEWAAVEPPLGHDDPDVVVVVPVYRGIGETMRCLYSVLTSPVQTRYRLLVVDDASPEPEISAELARLASRGLFELVINSENSGFVRSVNRGMQLATGRDVVLLNSDTEVYSDWLDRLSAAAWAAPRRGTVTPITNSGTIASYPRFVKDNTAPLEIDPAVLDGLAAETLTGETVEIPTCVGFCVYIRRDCLADVGLFDEEAFGFGYGEENDFSLRAVEQGWLNVLAADVFVRHYGSTSFGATAPARQRVGLEVLNARYPGYNRLIARHIADDPAAPLRRRLDLARMQSARRGRPAVLLVSHALGGGTTRHVNDLARQLDEQGVLPLLLRPAGNGEQVRLSSPSMGGTPNLSFTFSRQEHADLVAVLGLLDVVHVHVHHMQGYTHGATALPRLAAALGVNFDLTLHDYMTVCPRIDMVDHTRRFCGGPSAEKCRVCIAKNGSPFGRPDAAAWQAEHAELIRTARRVFVPSEDTARRFGALLPDVEFTVAPHPEVPIGTVEAPEPAADGLVHVAIFGALGVSKGSEVLLALAEDADRRRLPLLFHVFGYTNADAAFRHVKNVTVTGKYRESDLPSLVQAAGCRLALFPAVWPETFSYTLSEAVDLGLEPVAFDIGAIAGRLREMGRGTVLPWDFVDRPGAVNDQLLKLKPTAAVAPRVAATYDDLIRDYYGGLDLSRVVRR